jgi:hypothetical protein
MLGIALYSYLYLKLAKMLCLSYSTKSENKRLEQVLPGSGGRYREGAKTMYKHVSKCKNDKKK